MNYQDAGYIYAITNRKNGNAYIGSTVNYKSRWHHHRSNLRRGTHHSFILQKAWNKHGSDAFEFKLLVVCRKDQRVFYETLLMPMQSYNVLKTPRESMVRGGWKHTSETKQKMSEMRTGQKRTEESRKNISMAAIGRKYDQSFKDKARARQLGVIPSEETKYKLSLALKGKAKSSAHLANLKKSAAITAQTAKAKSLCRVKEAYQKVQAGMSAIEAIKDGKMSSATYYKYIKMCSMGDVQ